MMSFHDSMGRIGQIAIIDFVGTIAVVVLIGWWMNWQTARIIYWIVIALVLGEVVHIALKIDTPITRALGI